MSKERRGGTIDALSQGAMADTFAAYFSNESSLGSAAGQFSRVVHLSDLDPVSSVPLVFHHIAQSLTKYSELSPARLLLVQHMALSNISISAGQIF